MTHIRKADRVDQAKRTTSWRHVHARLNFGSLCIEMAEKLVPATCMAYAVLSDVFSGAPFPNTSENGGLIAAYDLHV